MAACNQTKVGEVYVCEKCGWEIEVKKTCSCGCNEDVSCCCQSMTAKKAADEDD